MATINAQLKDFKIGVEYKYLLKNSPLGVYLLPAAGRLRLFHGVIFVRRGLYKGGIFRFTLALQDNYPDINTHPQIVFTSQPPPFHPLIDAETGKVKISSS
jgi:ubiquitin-protein ligase